MSRIKVSSALAAAFVLLFAHIGQAQTPPLKFFKNYFLTGDYSVAGVSLWRKGVNGVASANIAIAGFPEDNVDVEAAFLYVMTAENTQGSGIDHANFEGYDLGPGTSSIAKALNWDNPAPTCWSFLCGGTRRIITYRADVLRFLPVKSNGKLRINGLHSIKVPDSGHWVASDDDEADKELSTELGPRAYGATLVLVYRDPRMPLKAIVIYDGAFTKRALATMVQPIQGFYQSTATSNTIGRLAPIVGDGQLLLSEKLSFSSASGDAATQTNQLIAINPFVGLAGRKWDNTTFNVPLPADTRSAAMTVDRNTLFSDCLSFSAVVFSAPVDDPDNDGLISLWELNSSANPLRDPNGVPLPFLKDMGADPRRPDLFVQIDYMETRSDLTYGGVVKPQHTHLPTHNALKIVGDMFAGKGINAHFDVGNWYQPNAGDPPDPYIIPAALAKGGHSINEMITVCTPNQGDPPSVCQFKDYPGTVGWKTGFKFLRDTVLSGPPIGADGQDPCDAAGSNCVRLFDPARNESFREAMFVHSVGIPKDPCQMVDSHGDLVSDPNCNTPDFHVPRTNSGIGDFPGGDLMVSLGAFDDSQGRPIGTESFQAFTLGHELGHGFEFTHAGPANPKVNGVIVPQVPRQANCKSNYFSSMNYMFQLRGLPDGAGILRMNYADEPEGPLDETSLQQAFALGLGKNFLPYRTGWYAPKDASYLQQFADIKAATKHCDGTPLSDDENKAIQDGHGMVRIDALNLLNTVDWNANGIITDTVNPQDINFNGVIDGDLTTNPPHPILGATVSDWANLYLNQTGSRRNVGAFYTDVFGRKAVGPLSLDIGRGDIGRGDIGRGDIGRGDIGRGDIGRGDIGRGDIGRGDIGRGDIGRGDIGRGYEGGGDLDVGSQKEFAALVAGAASGELDLETARAAEGNVAVTPPSGLSACLTILVGEAGYRCAGELGGDVPVLLQWQPGTLGAASRYFVYRYVPPAALPTVPIARLGGDGPAPTSYLDANPPVGTVAYFVRAQLFDGSLSGISNIAVVNVPGRADLAIANYTPASPALVAFPGQQVTLSSWRIVNQGTGNLNSGISNGFYLSTDPVITTADRRLDGNANSAGVLPAGGGFNWGAPTLTIPVDMPPGNYYIGILVDENNNAIESNEGNNYVSEPITITALPAQLTYNFTGVVTFVDPSLSDTFAEGMPLNGTFTYNTGAAGNLSGTEASGFRDYLSAQTDFAMTVGGYSAAPPFGTDIFSGLQVVNNFNLDRFVLSARLLGSARLFERNPIGFLALEDPSGTAFQNTLLTQAGDLTGWTARDGRYGTWYLAWSSNGTAPNISGVITSIQLCTECGVIP
jgi:hypothetical protein